MYRSRSIFTYIKNMQKQTYDFINNWNELKTSAVVFLIWCMRFWKKMVGLTILASFITVVCCVVILTTCIMVYHEQENIHSRFMWLQLDLAANIEQTFMIETQQNWIQKTQNVKIYCINLLCLNCPLDPYEAETHKTKTR